MTNDELTTQKISKKTIECNIPCYRRLLYLQVKPQCAWYNDCAWYENPPLGANKLAVIYDERSRISAEFQLSTIYKNHFLEPSQLLNNLWSDTGLIRTSTLWPHQATEMSSRLKVTTRVYHQHIQHSFSKAATFCLDYSNLQMPAYKLVSMTDSPLNCLSK